MFFNFYCSIVFYNVVLVSPVHQSGSVICIHDSSFLDFLPIHITTENWAEFPVLYNRFPLVIYFMHSINSVYQFSISQFIPTLLLSLLVSIRWFSVSYTCLKKKERRWRGKEKEQRGLVIHLCEKVTLIVK